MPNICFINPKWQICMDQEFNDFWRTAVSPNLIRNTYSGFGLSIMILAALTPKEYEIEIIDEIPKSMVGKVQRRVLQINDPIWKEKYGETQ